MTMMHSIREKVLGELSKYVIMFTDVCDWSEEEVSSTN